MIMYLSSSLISLMIITIIYNNKMNPADYLDWQPRSNERHMTFLLTCQIPKFNAHLTPLSVSVVKVPCDKRPTNLLKVKPFSL